MELSMEILYEHRADMVKLLPPGAKTVLDVGCNTGRLGQYLKMRGIEKVIGVDITPGATRVAAAYEDQVHLLDAEKDDLPYPEGYFDVIFYGDVLEHFRDPWEALRRHRKYLKDDGRIIASIPNAGHFGILGKLLRGNLHYEDAGLLDRGHLRFFTRESAMRLFEDCGYEVLRVEDRCDFVNGRVLDNQEIINTCAQSLLQSMQPDASRVEAPAGLFAIQYIFLVRKKVG